MLDIFYPLLNFPIRIGLDPISRFILSIGIEFNSAIFVIYSYFLLGCSVVSVGFILGVARRDIILLVAATLLANYVTMPGQEFVLACAAFGFFFSSLFALRLSFTVVKLVLGIFGGLYWLWLSGPLVVLGCIFIFICLEVLSGVSEDTKTEFGRKLVYLLLSLAAVVGIWCMPEYPMPEYPGGSRVVPISVRQFYNWPLLGNRLEPNPLLDDAYRNVLLGVSLKALPFFFLIIVISIFERLFYKNKRQLVFISALIFSASFLLIGELLTNQQASVNLMPFVAITRIIPGLSLVPFPWILLSMSFLIVFPVFFTCQISRSSITLLTIFPTLLLFCPNCRTFTALRSEIHDVNFSKKNLQSRYLEKEIGTWVSNPANVDRDEKLRLLHVGEDFQWTATASVKNDEAILGIDGSFDTRWSTGRPQQVGDKFIVKFDRPVGVSRVLLSVRNTPSDYPRGVRVQVGRDLEHLETVLEQADWLGPLRWTSQGFPYLGPQSEVILDFSRQYQVEYMVVTQIGESEKFDWSINDLRLYSK